MQEKYFKGLLGYTSAASIFFQKCAQNDRYLTNAFL